MKKRYGYGEFERQNDGQGRRGWRGTPNDSTGIKKKEKKENNWPTLHCQRMRQRPKKKGNTRTTTTTHFSKDVERKTITSTAINQNKKYKKHFGNGFFWSMISHQGSRFLFFPSLALSTLFLRSVVCPQDHIRCFFRASLKIPFPVLRMLPKHRGRKINKRMYKKRIWLMWACTFATCFFSSFFVIEVAYLFSLGGLFVWLSHLIR